MHKEEMIRQLDIEEAVLTINSENFDEKFHGALSEDEVTLTIIQRLDHANSEQVWAELHNQIDPSYQ